MNVFYSDRSTIGTYCMCISKCIYMIAYVRMEDSMHHDDYALLAFQKCTACNTGSAFLKGRSASI